MNMVRKKLMWESDLLEQRPWNMKHKNLASFKNDICLVFESSLPTVASKGRQQNSSYFLCSYVMKSNSYKAIYKKNYCIKMEEGLTFIGITNNARRISKVSTRASLFVCLF